MKVESFETLDSNEIAALWTLNQTTASVDQRANGYTKAIQVQFWSGSLEDPSPAKSYGRMDGEDLQFDGLMADILARFVNQPLADMDHEIQQALNLVCDALGLQWGQLWRDSTQNSGSFILTHHYMHQSPPGNAAAAEDSATTGSTDATGHDLIQLGTESRDLFPWLTGQARRGKTIVVSWIDDLPAEAALDKAMLGRLETRSSVLMPFLAEGRVFGAAAWGMRTEGFWPEKLLRCLGRVVTVFAQVTARKLLDEKLRASETQLSMAAASANAALWSLDLGTGRFRTTDKAYELLRLPLGSELTLERFLARVHPEDREHVRRTTEETICTGRDLSIEFRIVFAEGETCWVNSRGRCQNSATGVPERLMGATVDITERRAAQEALTKSYAEIKQLKDRLQAETDYLKSEIKVSHTHGQVIGQSKGIKRVLHDVEQVAPADCPVLITGETGTGKELIAQEIHRLSRRKNQMMILVNCAALPSALVESELFGRERGAYTGALTSQVGRFELAHGSTIFLDEVGELSLEVQAKLLRVLQQGEFQRLGSPKTHKVDVRVIAASNRDLAEEVRKGRFREDLYYRLNVFPIRIPPLRERIEDVPLLVFAFMEEFGTQMGKRITKLPRKAMDLLQGHTWPGNIRELRNVVEHSVIVTAGDTLKITVVGDTPTREAQPVTLAEAERQHILTTLQSTDWRIKGPHGAAKLLDLEPSTLYSRMQKLGIPHRRQKDEMSSLS